MPLLKKKPAVKEAKAAAAPTGQSKSTAPAKTGSGLVKKSTGKTTPGFFPMIRSRHPSHDPLRSNTDIKMPFRSVIRLGSETPVNDMDNPAENDITSGGQRIELNTVAAIQNSSNKLKMKSKFFDVGVKTPEYMKVVISGTSRKLIAFEYEELPQQAANVMERTVVTTEIDLAKNFNAEEMLEFPLIAKKISGSRGEGITLIKTAAEMMTFLQRHVLTASTTDYYFEKYYNYNKEYRLHVSPIGCFYTNRKVLKSETPEDQKFYRNDSNCSWLLENNTGFEKPSNWDAIIVQCQAALKSVGLDFGAFDVRVQNEKNSKNKSREGGPDFMLIEVNSAPSFGEGTLVRYVEHLPPLLRLKFESHNS